MNILAVHPPYPGNKQIVYLPLGLGYTTAVAEREGHEVTVLDMHNLRLSYDVLEKTLARQEFQAMATVLEEHMKGQQFIVGDRVTVADLVVAYTLDWANEVQLLDAFPQLRAYMEGMYARPKAPPRIAEAFASIQA